MLACGGESETTVDPGVEPQGVLTFESSVTGAHSHTLAVPETDVQRPLERGVTLETSSEEGHTHFVDLTRFELEAINFGQSVTRETTEMNGHSHTFTFSRVVAMGYSERSGSGTTTGSSSSR